MVSTYVTEGRANLRSKPHLLFEVPPVLLVYQNQVDIVTNRELLVDVSHGGRQLIPTQEQANGNGLPYRIEQGQLYIKNV